MIPFVLHFAPFTVHSKKAFIKEYQGMKIIEMVIEKVL